MGWLKTNSVQPQSAFSGGCLICFHVAQLLFFPLLQQKAHFHCCFCFFPPSQDAEPCNNIFKEPGHGNTAQKSCVFPSRKARAVNKLHEHITQILPDNQTAQCFCNSWGGSTSFCNLQIYFQNKPASIHITCVQNTGTKYCPKPAIALHSRSKVGCWLCLHTSPLGFPHGLEQPERGLLLVFPAEHTPPPLSMASYNTGTTMTSL